MASTLRPLAAQPIISQSIVELLGRHYHEHSIENKDRTANPVPVDHVGASDEDEIERQQSQHVILKNLLSYPPTREQGDASTKHNDETRDALQGLVHLDVIDILMKTGAWDCMKVLDIGAGAGSWASDVRASWPTNTTALPPEIHGVDVYAYETTADDQPLDGRVYSAKICWDLNDCLTGCRGLFTDLQQYQHRFDIIHVRCVADGVLGTRWWDLLHELYFLTKPGGGIQFVEVDWGYIQVDGRQAPSPAVERWCNWYNQGLSALGRDTRAGPDNRVAYRVYWNAWGDKHPQPGTWTLKNRLWAHGFRNTTSVMHRLKIGRWERKSGNHKEKRMAADMLGIMRDTLESLGAFPIREVLGVSERKYTATIDAVMEDLKRGRYFVPCYVITARRLLRDPVSDSGAGTAELSP